METANMTITDLLKASGIASNDFQAQHIANGLRLWECATDEEKLERAKLYRKWRPSTETKKSKRDELPSWQAYELAIAGINPDDVEPRQIEFEDKRYCPKCENEVVSGSGTYGNGIYDCNTCETILFESETDTRKGQTKSK